MRFIVSFIFILIAAAYGFVPGTPFTKIQQALTLARGSACDLLLEHLGELTRKKEYARIEQLSVFVFLSAIDGGFSGDWSRYGLISDVGEETLRSGVTSLLYLNLLCAPIAAYTAKQKNQPVIPALLHTLLIGGLGLAKVLFQTDETACNHSPFINAVYNFKQTLANLVAGEYDINAVNDQLDIDISLNGCVIYSFQKCPYCIRAKKIIVEELGATVKITELDEDNSMGNPIRAELGKRTGRTSLPSIWIGGDFIGGCNDGPDGGVVAMQAAGKLQPLLAEANAISRQASDLPSVGLLEAGRSLRELYTKYRAYGFFLLPVILYAAAELGALLRQ